MFSSYLTAALDSGYIGALIAYGCTFQIDIPSNYVYRDDLKVIK